jgi:hypothetical protein
MQLAIAYDKDEVAAFRTGSAFPNLDIKGLLQNLYVRIPPESEAERFAMLINCACDCRLALESRRLKGVQDALLPKLVSGGIRVPESCQR